jgi:hypothetical protein
MATRDIMRRTTKIVERINMIVVTINTAGPREGMVVVSAILVHSVLRREADMAQ